MSVEPAGLLLTLAAVIAVRLGDGWVHRRRVRRRLRRLIEIDNPSRKVARLAQRNRAEARHRRPVGRYTT